MDTEHPLTERERKQLTEILSDPKKLDNLIDTALRGWRKARAWRRRTKRS